MSDTGWTRATSDGLRIDVEVKVRASRTAVLGVKNGRLSVALAAPPVEGAANDALQRALAEFFELPRRSVLLVAGEKSRRKSLTLKGVTLEGVLARVAALGTPDG